MSAANPVQPEAEPPGEVMTAAVLLDLIDDRSGAMAHDFDSQEQGPSGATPGLRRNWVVAFAAGFAVVVIVGVSIVLLNRGGGPLEVVSPVTTAPPTTVPDAMVTSVLDMAPLVIINADQVNYPVSDDEAFGVAIADGMLWATTEAGIVRWDLDERHAVLFASGDGLPFDDGSSGRIAAAPDGTIWAFTWNQDVARFDGARWAEPAGYNQIDIVNPRCTLGKECLDPVTAMAVGPDGLLSLAIGEDTLLQFDGVDWSVLAVTPEETHGGSAWATDMAVTSDGTLWVASWEELLSYDGDTWVRYTAADGLPPGMLNTVAVAPNGDVWIGTTNDFEGEASGGVARFDGESWTAFDETDGLYDNNVVALTIGADGAVWAVHSATGDLDSSEEVATGGISRFDGTGWSATTVSDVEIGFGYGGAAIDDETGTLWITSRWGAVGFDGTEATVLRFPDGTRPPINALPFTLSSQILAGSEGPIEWQWWDWLSDGTNEAMNTQALIKGSECYGSGGDQLPSGAVEFRGGSIDFALGYQSTPDVVATDAGGAVTQVGNPFGENAWLCSVATTDTHILTVGTGVSWSEDAITWHGIEAFEEIAGSNIDGPNLKWAAAGPGGYMVFGDEGDVWFSEDLQTWYETNLENEGYGTSIWGWVGPMGVAVGEEIVISMFDDGWVGTRRAG